MTMKKRMPALVILFAVAIISLVSCNDVISYKRNLAESSAITSLVTTSGAISLVAGQNVYPFPVDAKTDRIQLRAVLGNSGNRLSINGFPCSSGEWSPVIALPEGRTTSVTIVVCPNVSAPEDGDVHTYTVEVTPAMEWGKPEAFFSDAMGDSQIDNMQVVGNAAGQMLAVWFQYFSGYKWILMMSECDKDGVWTYPTKLPCVFEKSQLVKIDLNKTGSAIIAWVDEMNPGIQAITKQNGKWPDGLLGNAIDTISDLSNIEGIDCSIDSSGNAVVAWSLLTEGAIYERSKLARTANWTEKILVNENVPALLAKNPKVDINADGVGFFAWRQTDASGNSIMSRSCSIATNTMDEKLISVDNEPGNKNLCVEMTNTGLGFLFWDDTLNQTYMTTMISSSGILSDTKKNVSGPIGGSSFNTGTAFDVSSTGLAIAVWQKKVTISSHSEFVLYGAVFDGRLWTSPKQISGGYEYGISCPLVCINDNGRAALAFCSCDKNNIKYMTVFTYNGLWSEKECLDSVYGQSEIKGLSIDSDGKITCLWSYQPMLCSSTLYVSQYQ